MPDNSLPQQYDPILKRQSLEHISFDDLDPFVRARLLPNGGSVGQVLTRTIGGAGWTNAGQPNFTTGTVQTSPNLLDANVIVNGTAPNYVLDWILPVGVGATPNLNVTSVVTMLDVGQPGQAFMSGPPENRLLTLSLPRSPVPAFYVNSVTYGVNPFDAQVTLSGIPDSIGFNFRLPRGQQGLTGLTPNLTVAPLVTMLPVNAAGQASMTGTAENPILNLSLPRSPIPTFSIIGTNTLPHGANATVFIGGTPENPTLSFGIPQGAPGPVPTLGIGTVSAGVNFNDAQASFTGTPQNPLLNLVLPRGLTGLTPNLSVNPSVTMLPVGAVGQATMTGTANNPVLNLSLPRSPVPAFTVAATNTLAAGMNASVSLGGTFENPSFTFGIPQGLTGLTPNLTVNPVVTMLPVNATGQASMTGTTNNPVLNLSLPRSPVPAFSIAATNTLPSGANATVSLGGTFENPSFTFGIPQGAPGATPTLGMGTVTTLPPGANATASLSGTPLNPLLNLGLPRGSVGSGGFLINGGGPYTNIILGGGNAGDLLYSTSSLNPGEARLFATHRIINHPSATNPAARDLVANPGDFSAHLIKKIRGVFPLNAIDDGSEIRLSADLSGFMPSASNGGTMVYENGEWIQNRYITVLPTSVNNNPADRKVEISTFYQPTGPYFLPTKYSLLKLNIDDVLLGMNSVGGFGNSSDSAFLALNNSVFGGTATIGGSTIFLNSTKLSFFNANPVPRQSLPAAANDLPSAITLLNALRQGVLNYGLFQSP